MMKDSCLVPRFLKALMLLLASLFAAVPAVAAAPSWTPYDAAEFSRAQEAGKTIVVDIHAKWCPTCKAQAPTLDTLLSEPRLKGAVFVKVDFDKEKAFLRQHRIPRQSTILVFKGKRETARSIAETRPDRLRAAILAGI
jgi:thioredoxin 1